MELFLRNSLRLNIGLKQIDKFFSIVNQMAEIGPDLLVFDGTAVFSGQGA